jgi:hypothetical protein
MTFPTDQLPLHVEVALGANLTGDPAGWAWTDFTTDSEVLLPGTGGTGADALYDGPDALLWFGEQLAFGPDGEGTGGGPSPEIVPGRVLAEAISITRGRSDEASQSQPSSANVAMVNDDGALTPHNPMSPYYPYIRRSTPIRFSVENEVALFCGSVGAAASTPDTAAFDLTDDLWLACEFDAHNEYGTSYLISKWTLSGGQKSYGLGIRNGKIVFHWADNILALNEVAAPMPPKSSNGHTMVGASAEYLSAGIMVVTFYYADEWGTWTSYFRDTTDSPGGGGPQATTAPLDLGRAFKGKIYRAELRNNNSPAATLLASPIPANETHGDATWVDAQARTWTVQPGSAITNRDIRFCGQISEIVPSWPAGDISNEDEGDVGLANVHFAAAGTLRRLGQGTKEVDSPIKRVVMSKLNYSDVRAYWPMEEEGDANAFSAMDRTWPWVTRGERTNVMTRRGGFTPGAEDSLLGSKALPGMNEAGGWSAVVPRLPTTPTSWAVDSFLLVPERSETVGFSILNVETTGSPWTRWSLRLGPTSLQLVWINRNNDDYGEQTWAQGTFPTGWVHVRLSGTKVGSVVQMKVKITKIDEDDFGGATQVVNVAVTTMGQVIGINNYVDNTSMPPSGMAQGHVILHRTRPETWLIEAARAHDGERAMDRIYRLCIENGVTPSLIGPVELSQPLGPQPISDIMSILDDCVNVDLGLLNDARHSLGLEYRSSTSLYNQNHPIELNAKQDKIANPFVPVEDDQALRNDVTAQMSNGDQEWREFDQDSIDLEGIYDDSVTVNVHDAIQLPDQAGWRLHTGTKAGMRYPSLSLDLGVVPLLIPRWLATNPGTALRLLELPHAHPFDVDLIVQGYTETLDPFMWIVNANCTRGDIWQVGVVEDAVLGRVESNGTYIQDPIDDNDTTFDTFASGTRWIDSANFPTEFPFNIVLNGEEMTVTAISGLTLSQTWTVVRSANGVVKSHPALTDVKLATPLVLAL